MFDAKKRRHTVEKITLSGDTVLVRRIVVSSDELASIFLGSSASPKERRQCLSLLSYMLNQKWSFGGGVPALPVSNRVCRLNRAFKMLCGAPSLAALKAEV